MAYVPGAPRDPTAVVGRRITAYLLDGLLGAIVLAVVLSMMKHDTFTDAPANACSVLRARHSTDSFDVTCLQIASRAWLWKSTDALIAAQAAVIVGILNLVVLQAVTGASFGKHVLGLRVVDAEGQPPGFGRTIVRWLFLIVDAIIFLVGLVAVLTTRFHRRIGDLAAGTYVVGKVSAGRPIGMAPPPIPYGGPVFAPPAVGANHASDVPAPPAPLAPGWGVAQPSAPLAASTWDAPPVAPPPRTYTPPEPPVPPQFPAAPPTPVARPPAAPAVPAAPPTPPPMPAAPPAAPPAPPTPTPAAPAPTRTYVPPEPAAPAPAARPPAPAPSRTYIPPEPAAPSPAAPRPAPAPTRTYIPPEPATPPRPPVAPPPARAPAHTALPRPKPPERQTVPQPESWWDTAVPNDPPDGEEQS